MYDLATLAAIEDIRRLEARYARYADEKRWDDLAELFTDDGWFRPQDVDGNTIANMVGHEDISTSLGSRMSGDVQPIHQLFTHEITLESPTTASAIWAMADLIFRGDSAFPEQEPGDPLPPFRTMRLGPLPRHLPQGRRPLADRHSAADPHPPRLHLLTARTRRTSP